MLHDGIVDVNIIYMCICWMHRRRLSNTLLPRLFTFSSGMISSGIRYVRNVMNFSCSAEPVGKFGLLMFIFQMIHVFRDYGPGVRYIRFAHGGKDTQFWAGWYGIRVTDSSVEICPAVDVES